MDGRLESKRVQQACKEYFCTLGFGSEKETEQAVIKAIRDGLEKKGTACAPIFLSSVADVFQIDPTPRFNNEIQDGKIEYKEDDKKFVITLSNRFGGVSRRELADDLLNESPDAGSEKSGSKLTKRARFTYAHEFAHRFFFARDGQSWSRALVKVTQNCRDANRIAIRNRLHLIEESICSRIAGEILVPPEDLVEMIDGYLARVDRGLVACLLPLLKTLSRCFMVSRECLLVRFSQYYRRGLLELPQNFCLMLIITSDRKAWAGRSELTQRIKISIVPREIGGWKIRRIYPGIAVENLGDQLQRFSMNRTSIRSEGQVGHALIPLTLLKSGKGSGGMPIRAALDGWWTQFRIWSGAEQEDCPILLWGQLRIDSC